VTPKDALRPGSELAPGYEVIEHLARSNVLDVYDAWSYERGTRVAVKVLRPDRAADRAARQALLREGRILMALAHPHIVRAYDLLQRPQPGVVLETLSGETLAHLIDRRKRRLTAAELGFMGLQLSSAVSYLHRRGLLHLDLKPSNVVAELGRAKLIDMSVARPLGRAKADIGTWCYMAPEQARGGVLTAAADVWGLGGVLFEAATGDCAFDDGSEEGYPQLEGRAPPVRSLRRLPEALGAAIDACLDPDASARPTVAELVAACEEAAGLPVAERRLGRG
jgi:serine/threonine protein kinase